jgi:hypothetical protein
MRPSGVIRGMWRILDEKVDEWKVFMFRTLKVVAPA